MTTEIWKDVRGYEGRYQISNLGKIKSLKRPRVPKDRILNKWNGNNKYQSIRLTDGIGNKQTFYIHRLVAEYFVPNENQNNTIVNHKDENPNNNDSRNLEWCDHSYNAKYGISRKKSLETRYNNGHWINSIESREKPIKGVSVADGHIIRFKSMREADRKGFKAGAICRCIKNQKGHKTHKGYIWSNQ